MYKPTYDLPDNSNWSTMHELLLNLNTYVNYHTTFIRNLYKSVNTNTSIDQKLIQGDEGLK